MQRIFCSLIGAGMLFMAFVSSAGTVTLPETGQILCYDNFTSVVPCAGTGQDGALRKGAAWPSPRFTVNMNGQVPDGTVTDNLTGLVWLRDTGCTDTVGGIVNPGRLTWQNALIWSNNLGNGDCSLADNSSAGDWRLPNRNELESLIDLSMFDPALPSGHPFLKLQANGDGDSYWTSSSHIETGDGTFYYAWTSDFYNGSLGLNGRAPSFASTASVWPVRISQPSYADLVVSPNPIAFGSVAVGSSTIKTVILSNQGNDSLSVTEISALPLNVYSLSPGTCSSMTPTIAVGSSCALELSCSPVAAIDVNSSLTVASNAIGGTQSIPLTCSGYIPVIYTVTGEAVTANGTVTPASQGIESGGTAILTIAPNPGYKVVKPLVGTCPQGDWDGNSYFFSPVTQDCTVRASFTPADYTITASAGSNGSISPPGATILGYNDSQSYTITPATGYKVVDVLVDGVSVGAVSSYTFSSVSADHTISASFALITSRTITATAGANGTISPPGKTAVMPGGSQSYTITPVSGYKIADLLVDNVSVGAVASYTFSNVTADHTINARFALITSFTITASGGANGTISPAGATAVPRSGSQSYAITPAAGYRVADVLIDGVSVGALSTYTFSTVTADHTISASFAPITYTITASAGSNGSLTPAGATSVARNGSQSYTITPADGYKISDVLVDGVSVGAVSSYTFNSVTADHTISARFAVVVHTITPVVGGNGTISPSGEQSVSNGGTKQFTVTPSSGFTALVAGCGGTLSGTIYTTGPVTASCKIAVIFSNVTLADALRAYKIAQGFITQTASDLVKLDVTGRSDGGPDGRIDLKDVILLLKKSLGIEQ